MRESTDNNARLNALLARVVEETITAEEFGELESLLDGNREAQRRYVHYLGLHVDLRHAGVGAAEEAPGRRRWSGAALLGAAAMAAAVVFMVTLMLPRDRVTPIARIAELHGSVEWTGDGGQVDGSLVVGDVLGGGTLETLATNSWAEIVFLDGSAVWVSGPALLTLSEGAEGKVIRLRRGDLSVAVTPQPEGKPLHLITPSAQAEVLGTQFNVSADSQSTRLEVNEGLVSVERLADGSVQKVPANHLVVAALERGAEFRIVPRSDYAEEWTSRFPRDVRRGDWLPGTEDAPGRLRTRSCLWIEDDREPDLHYSVNIGVSATGRPPTRLVEGARFRIRGRLNSSQRVIFGITTHHARGGFAGKYLAARDVEVSGGSERQFDLDLPLGELNRSRELFPASPAGLELFDCWALTHEEEAGLEIVSVELVTGGSG